MRILLPPSEGKRTGGSGRSLVRRSSTRIPPGLLVPRGLALDALARTISLPSAAQRLLLPESIAPTALAENSAVLTGPTMPALRRYQGVVYEGLAADRLSPAASVAAGRAVLIFSGLFGVLRGDEPVPAYRVPAKAKLDSIGIAGTFWRPYLQLAMPALLGRQDEPIVDLRSADYAAMWQPLRDDPLARRVIGVRILSPKPNGELAVISFASKYAKGLLAAGLLERLATGDHVRTAADVAETWLRIGGRAARVLAAQSGTQLELVTQTSTLPINSGKLGARR
ncbi:MAG: hypothetical protein JWN95_3460 [Frankiales bacterium]|nr:hypothetical protein [Frankiales bacterium]